MNDAEALAMCTQVLVGGLDTVINLMGFVMNFLAQNPKLCAELAENPALIPAAVNEMIRRLPIINVCREIADDIEYEGVQMKKGEMIVAPTMLDGLDERENQNPYTFDMKRTRQQHSTFGGGHHICPGARLARSELKILLEEWLQRIPEFSVDPDCEVSYSGGIVSSTDPFTLIWKV
jgi:cytochrome P450